MTDLTYHNEQQALIKQLIKAELRGWRQPLDRTTGAIPSVQLPTAGTATAARGAVTFHQGTPQPIGTAGVKGGSAGYVSYADHVHAHGNLPGGALHGTATAGTAGFVLLSDATPSPDGTVGSPGTATTVSRSDHIHVGGGTAGGGGAPTDATYITQTANSSLSNEQALSSLSTGLVKVTTSTGVLSTAVAGTDYVGASSTGAAGSEPGSPATGDLYLPNNGFVVERYSGSLWAPWGPLYPLTAPPTASWSWDNQGSCTVATTNGGLSFYVPANASGNTHVYHRAASSAPYTITAMFLPGPMFSAGVQGFGLCFRESSSGKIHAFYFQNANSGAPQLLSNKWTTTTSFSAGYTSFASITLFGGVVFLRIADDNTNRVCSISTDGQHFQALHTTGRTDFLTADQVGVFFREGTTYDLYAELLSWA